MDKLKLAHDYAMVRLTTSNPKTLDEIITLSWYYADAMQAEADKRVNKERPDVLGDRLEETTMNLIEQLGGYDEARKCAVILSEKLTEKQKSNAVFMDAFNALNDELFKYRRANNIFELGDKVVLTNMSDNEVFEYTEYSKGLDLHFFESEHNYGHAKLSGIRHATPQEIKAGHRL